MIGSASQKVIMLPARYRLKQAGEKHKTQDSELITGLYSPRKAPGAISIAQLRPQRIARSKKRGIERSCSIPHLPPSLDCRPSLPESRHSPVPRYKPASKTPLVDLRRSVFERQRSKKKSSQSSPFSHQLSLSPDDPTLLAEQLEAKLEFDLQPFTPSNTDIVGELSIYSHCFTDVLKAVPAFHSVLRKIKDKYEAWVLGLSERERLARSQCQEQLISLQGSLLQEMEEKKSLTEEVRRLESELREVRKSGQDYENKYQILYDKLKEISEADTDDYPPTEHTWKVLNTELKAYKRLEASLRAALNESMKKENRLIALVAAMRKQGFPVDRVRRTEVPEASSVGRRSPPLRLDSAFSRFSAELSESGVGQEDGVVEVGVSPMSDQYERSSQRCDTR